MKKISLKSLKSEELLSREELKQIMGGTTGSDDSGWATFKCKCNNSSITWEARYQDVQDMINYIDGTCPSGGSCTAS
jgi:hypothetical protein